MNTRSPQFTAALVMIAWLATVISAWGIAAAGRPPDSSCCSEEVKNPQVHLEMAADARAVAAILSGAATTCKAPGPTGEKVKAPDEKRAACIRASVAAQVCADYLFIPSYSFLVWTLFLFVRSLRGAPRWTWTLTWGGLLLAATIAVSDVLENLRITHLIELAGRSPLPTAAIGQLLPSLKLATFTKMGAVALAVAVLATVWVSRSGSRLVWVLRLVAYAAVILLGVAIDQQSVLVTKLGMLTFVGFGLAALVHAIVVAVSPPPPPVSRNSQHQGGAR